MPVLTWICTSFYEKKNSDCLVFFFSAELALEEICRSETDYVEDMDTEAGP